MIYLATPYSSLNKEIVEQRNFVVTKCAAILTALGLSTYSPITHDHQMLKHKIPFPTSWEYWKKHQEKHLNRCSVLLIIKQDGWDTSVGVNGEREIAKALSIPTYAICPQMLERLHLLILEHVPPLESFEDFLKWANHFYDDLPPGYTEINRLY